MSQEHQTNKLQTGASPVIVWEQKVDRTQDINNKVVSIDNYRRHGSAPMDSEATITSQILPTSTSDEPIRLIMVSSGFGQKPSHSNLTIQSLAA
ncbi:hypothetical protein GK047_24585 [Paenibacillus sp. SYP-B3998]|uniref:Uncharacterized protein n=1 Tax=Paenibacillus sp. SYP-B3998 TaxID=2678564 RepID=A0A6G4A3S9_9BACL|nr:hypothetical protein [Paenibacillus sp. SYP-B3998]NEW09156.1 hypothetical protein [Paenibacillus sp. SYP-B3998]